MTSFLIFGFFYQLLISFWTIFFAGIVVKGPFFIYILISQLMFSMMCHFSFLKKYWKTSWFLSIITSILFIYFLIKVRPESLYVASVVPLIIYYLILTAISSYKRNEGKIDYDFDKRHDVNEIDDSEIRK